MSHILGIGELSDRTQSNFYKLKDSFESLSGSATRKMSTRYRSSDGVEFFPENWGFFGQFAMPKTFVSARNWILVFLRWFASFGKFSKRLLCDLLNRPSPMPKPWNESCWDLHSAPIRHWSRIWNRLEAFRDIFREHGTRNVEPCYRFRSLPGQEFEILLIL